MKTLFDVEPNCEPDLPPMEGTDRQLEWAQTVRRGKLAHCRKLIRDAQELVGRSANEETRISRRAILRRYIDGLERLEKETSCRFWLDHRNNSAMELVTDAPADPGNEFDAPSPDGGWTR